MTTPDLGGQHLCRCDALDDAADNPQSPVIFDELTNEYQIEHRAGGGHTVVYFCFFCGGRPPGSRRDKLFARLTSEEIHRLKELTQDIHTAEDAIRLLGQPDHDFPAGSAVILPESGEQPPFAEVHRTLWFGKQSESADIMVTVHDNGRIAISFGGKSLDPNQRPQPRPPMRAKHRAALLKDKETVFCFICGKTEHEAAKIIAFPQAGLCDECIRTCAALIES